MTTDVGVYTFGENIPLPSFGSDLASCFDLAYQNPRGLPIQGYDSENKPGFISLISEMVTATQNGFYFPPNTRLLVPTGMIFDLPRGHDMRVHPRSGVSFKQGLTLINCEGVIDEDYTQQLFIPMINFSSRSVLVTQGMRLAQAEIWGTGDYQTSAFAWKTIGGRVSRPNFVRLENEPEPKTNRTGGFGSTGTS